MLGHRAACSTGSLLPKPLCPVIPGDSGLLPRRLTPTLATRLPPHRRVPLACGRHRAFGATHGFVRPCLPGLRRGWRSCHAALSPSPQPAGSLDEGDLGGRPGPQSGPPLTLEQLKRLTELHVGNVYDVGVVDSAEELAARLGTSLQVGLASDEAGLEARRARYGSNRVKGAREATFWELAWEALQDFTVVVLLVAGAASLGLELLISGPAGEAAGVASGGGGRGSWIEGASILTSVAVVVLVTAVNNYQKEAQFRALQDVHRDTKVRAIRDRHERSISVFELLVGDLVVVETGDILPVDGVLVEGPGLKVDESHLTGESDDVDKSPEAAQSLLSGSKVLSGFGRMLVTAVGPNSQAGAIAEMVADGKVGAMKQGVDGLKEETMLQSKLTNYATAIGRFGLWSAVLAWAAMTARFSYETFIVEQLPWSWEFLHTYLSFFITGVTILVVAVPEGLPLAVTLSLAYSVKRMLADNNLVRHLSAAETMGTATVICSDKTGTLTQNNMVVSRLWLCGQLLPDLRPYMTASSRKKPLKSLLQTLGTSSSVSSILTASGDESDDSSPSSSDDPAPAAAPAPPARQAQQAQQALAPGENPAVLRSSLHHSLNERLLPLLGQALAMNSTANVFRDGDGHLQKVGNRTEVALLSLGLLLGLDLQAERNRNVVVAQAPFTSERKRMTTAIFNQAFRSNGTTALRVFTKGAAELVLDMCSQQLDAEGAAVELSPEDKQRLLGEFTSGSQRVLCLAYRDVVVPTEALPCAAAFSDSSLQTYQESMLSSVEDVAMLSCDYDAGVSLVENLERDLVLIGVVGIEDPLRPEVPLAIQQCQGAGITVKMLTGDNIQTAVSIAKQCGILPPDVQPPMPNSSTLSFASGSLSSSLASLASRPGSPESSSSGRSDSEAQQAQQEAQQQQAAAAAGGLQQRQQQGQQQRSAGDGSSSDAGASRQNGYASSSGYISGSSSGGEQQLPPPPQRQEQEQQPQRYGEQVAAPPAETAALALSQPAGPLALWQPQQGAQQAQQQAQQGAQQAQQGPQQEWAGPGSVMEGSEFRRRVLRPDGSIDGDAFMEVWPKLRVMARCTPADKYTIVQGVKTFTDEVIAVTGDGTNDAPALRAANVGFAMNIGTDTAKEAADIVLMDNNFSSIVSAVLWGRGVYANITRFLQFQLTINLVAVATAVAGAVIAAESPLTAVQMLWVNLIMDSLASLALATEPPSAKFLTIPPFSKDHEFVDPTSPTVKHIVGQALYQLVVMYLLVFHGPALLGVPDHASVVGPSEHYTIVFNAFVQMQLFNQVNARKILDGSQVWEGLSTAGLFNSIMAGEFVLQALIVQYGGLAFHTHPLSVPQWGVCMGIGATTLLVREALRRVPNYGNAKGGWMGGT